MPGTTESTTEQISKSTTSVKPSASGASLANFDSCTVLESVASQLNLTEIEAVDDRECGAFYKNEAGAVGLTKHPELAIGDAVGDGKKTDIRIGSRKAKLVEEPAGNRSCLVAVEVTPTARVDVITSSRTSLDEACETATEIANVIEPAMPK